MLPSRCGESVTTCGHMSDYTASVVLSRQASEVSSGSDISPDSWLPYFTGVARSTFGFGGKYQGGGSLGRSACGTSLANAAATPGASDNGQDNHAVVLLGGYKDKDSKIWYLMQNCGSQCLCFWPQQSIWGLVPSMLCLSKTAWRRIRRDTSVPPNDILSVHLQSPRVKRYLVQLGPLGWVPRTDARMMASIADRSCFALHQFVCTLGFGVCLFYLYGVLVVARLRGKG
jgi:hypothetical protein